jgi:hypothetical protein
MNDDELQTLIAKCFADFYQQRIQRLEKLTPKEILERPNAYLFKAIGAHNIAEIVEGVLANYLDSLDGGLFGDAFLEPIAQAMSGDGALFGKSAERRNQALWERLISVPNYYPQLIRFMETRGIPKYLTDYDLAWSRISNWCARELVMNYCDESGAIEWEKLAKLNSGDGLESARTL